MITLNKQNGRDFCILYITDLHIMPHEWKEGHEVRKSVEDTINKLIDKTNPDLIIHGGDFSAAENAECYTKFAHLLDSYGIPWTTVWGNHDNQCGEAVTRRYAEEFLTYKSFVYEHGPKELGNGNFVLGIKENGSLIHALILMDSHNRVDYRDHKGDIISVYAPLSKNQLSWYADRIKELVSLGCNETTLMCHTPPHAFKKAFSKAFNYSLFSPHNIEYKDSFDEKYWNASYKGSFGVRYEGECTYPEDDGVFAALKELGSTKLVVCGHDHTNCSCIEYNGIKLMYGLKTGRGSYFDERLCGGTGIFIDSLGETRAEHIFVEL